MGVRLGCFGNLDDLDAIEAAGYDCAELDLQEIMALGEDQYRQLKKRIKNSALQCEVYNTMIPLKSSIISPDFDAPYWVEFSKRAAQKAAELGARYYVFGNGYARRIPEEGDIAGGRAKVLGFLNTLCDITQEYGIKVLIEPLSHLYSNFILSLREAVDVIKEMGRENLMTMVDLRHMVTMGEPLEEIVRYKDYILHVHIDNPLHPERYFPKMGDGYNYRPFLETLKKINYKGIISVEARYYMTGEARREFPAEAAQALKFFRSFDLELGFDAPLPLSLEE
ncbi:MAG: sugar phosphate isomerase/epimerase family protein [Desulfotomaculales bacterium]